MLLSLLLLLGCTPEGPAATPAQRAVVEALSHRHGVDCDAAAAVADDPAADLAWVAETWPDPPWVGVRAAECLALRADDATWGPVAARWEADPELLGLWEAATRARLDRGTP